MHKIPSESLCVVSIVLLVSFVSMTMTKMQYVAILEGVEVGAVKMHGGMESLNKDLEKVRMDNGCY